MTSQKKLQQLQKEAIALRKTINEKDKIIGELKQQVSNQFKLIDLLQSFIPEQNK